MLWMILSTKDEMFMDRRGRGDIEVRIGRSTLHADRVSQKRNVFASNKAFHQQ